jgi:hypothetical protein
MTDGKPRSATLPDDREAYRGVAFERNESAEGWKRRKAQQEEITGEIMAKLEQVGELMQTLGALGWDGGGQPFVCETTMKKTRDKARTDGRKYAYRQTVRPRKGEPFPVLVGNAGPHKETVKALAIWPKGHLEDVLTGVLQPQFSPAHDLCMVRVLEQMAALLTPDQLSYLKAPAGRVIKLPSANGNDYFHFRERGGFVAAEQQIHGSHSAHRYREREVLTLCEALASPSARVYRRPIHHHGIRDLTPASKEWQEQYYRQVCWAFPDGHDAKRAGACARASSCEG